MHGDLPAGFWEEDDSPAPLAAASHEPDLHEEMGDGEDGAVPLFAGTTLIMVIAMLVFSWIIGNHTISHENSRLFLASARLIFALLAVICVFGVFASLSRGRLHSNPREDQPGCCGARQR